MTEFVVYGAPVAAPRMTRGAVHAKDHPKRKYIDAYLEHKDTIGWSAKAAGIELIPKPVPVAMWVTFYAPDARKRDSKNMLSTCEDALSGIAYEDDSQIVFHELRKHIDRKFPRTEIKIIACPEWEMES